MSTDAVILAFDSLVGLSYGDPETREHYSLLLAPWDPPEVAGQMASGQSSCALALCAALLIAEVDGMVRGWRGRPACDPLREPRRGHYDAIMFLETLALQRGLHQAGTWRDSPPIGPGWIVQIGGDGSGPEHVLLATGAPDAAGRFPSVEGGKLDHLSKNTGAAACTAITRDVRTLGGGAGKWNVNGRRVRWAADAGALPCCGEGMPWHLLGFRL